MFTLYVYDVFVNRVYPKEVHVSLHAETYWYLQQICMFLLPEPVACTAVKHCILWSNKNELIP